VQLEGQRKALKINATLHQVIDAHVAKDWANDANKTLH
jgi:hypothetical protein